jgi:hypothetical protein
MSKIYNIIFSGIVGCNVTNITNSCSHYFDWGRLPKNKKWRCSITYMGAAFGWTTAQTCSLYINFNNDAYIAFNAAASSPISRGHQYCGLLQASNYATACYFYSKNGSNKYFYLDTTPTNNNVDIFLLNGSQGLFTGTWNNHCLCLTMEMVDDLVVDRPLKFYDSYNVVFMSSQCDIVSTNFYNFFIDWDVALPKQGKYIVRFAFVCNDMGTGVQYSGDSVFMDIGQRQSVLFANSKNNNIIFRRTDYLGSLFETPTNSGYSEAFSTGIYDNAPIYLDCRPTNNNVSISFLNWYNPQGYRLLTNWVLTLNFQYLGE